jgi:hypothetical protein
MLSCWAFAMMILDTWNVTARILQAAEDTSYEFGCVQACGEAIVIVQSALRHFSHRKYTHARKKAKVAIGIFQVVVALVLDTPGAVISAAILGVGAPVLTLAAIAFTPAVNEVITRAVKTVYTWKDAGWAT